jgi:hypothetical protein
MADVARSLLVSENILTAHPELDALFGPMNPADGSRASPSGATWPVFEGARFHLVGIGHEVGRVRSVLTTLSLSG